MSGPLVRISCEGTYSDCFRHTPDVPCTSTMGFSRDCDTHRYRDEEHRSRSLRSYQIERGFYEQLAPLSISVQETCRFAVPQTYAHVWNGAGTEGELLFSAASFFCERSLFFSSLCSSCPNEWQNLTMPLMPILLCRLSRTRIPDASGHVKAQWPYIPVHSGF